MKQIKFLIFSLFLASGLFAQANITQDEIDFQNKVSNANNPSYIDEKSSEPMDEYFQRIADEMGFSYGPTENKDKFFYNASATVSLTPTDADFGKAVVIAYDKAVLDMQSQYIVDIFGNIATQKVQENFANYSSNAKDFPSFSNQTKISAVMDKTLDFVGAKLDKALEELGVDPNKVQEKEKKDLFREKFFQSVITSAFGRISGLIPIETRIAKDETGAYEVGVIGVISSKTRQIARDMAFKRASLIEGRGRDLKTILPSKSKDYIKEVGLRLAYNQNATPTILSYGIWSYGQNETDPYMLKRQKDIAKETAKAKADAALVEFINTNVAFKDERKTGEEIANVIKRETTSESQRLTQEQTKNIIDEVFKSIKTNASGSVKGILTLKTWSAKDENGIPYVGVVRYYTHDNVKAIENMLNPSKQQAKRTIIKTQEVHRVSKRVNDIDDF